MIWPFILLSSIWLGFEILTVFSPSVIDPLTLIAASVPVGFALTSWFFLLVRFFLPLNYLSGIVISITIFGACLSIRLLTPARSRRTRRRGIDFFCVLLGVTFLFLVLVDASILKDGVNSSGTVFSDLPFHLGLITSFAYGPNSYQRTMTTPFYAGEKLAYPIIPDFFSAVLVICGGASLRISVAVPTMVLLIALVVLVDALARYFSQLRFVPGLTIICFFFASGVGWRYFFVKECRENQNANMSHCFCANVFTFWIHPLIHFLLPQRSALFSMPIVVFITILVIQAAVGRSRERTVITFAGFLMGLLSMISAHSFIAIGEYALFSCAWHFPWRQKSEWLPTVKFWAHFGGAALIVGIPQVLWLARTPRPGFMTISAVWLETFPNSFKALRLWWDSLGSFVFLALIIAWASLSPKQLGAYIPALGVFVVSNFVIYQPGAMDNTKVFFAGWYPLACCAVAHCIVWLCANGGWAAKGLVLFAIAGFLAGSFVTVGKALIFPFQLFTIDELDFGGWVMQNTPKDAVFMGSMWHSNTAMTIGGRHIAMGYGGWVWSHGLNLTKRIALVRELVDNREDRERLEQFGVKYALVRPDDHSNGFQFPPPPPTSRWVSIIEAGTLKVYRMLRN
jgi:hypothetical protein